MGKVKRTFAQRKLIAKVKAHHFYPELNGVEKHAIDTINFQSDEEASKLIFGVLMEMDQKMDQKDDFSADLK
jgi:hypothetical protein